MRRLVYSLAGTAAVLAAGVGMTVAVPASAYAAGPPLAQVTAIVNPPPQPGLLSLCITSHSLDPNGTCINIPPTAGSPGLTYGTATAESGGRFGPGAGFQFQGQITIGGQTFVGTASGGVGFAGVQVPPFTLSGTSPNGSLTATCSGVFEGVGEGVLPPGSGAGAVGGAISRLDCVGSANGGPVGHVTLVSVYRATDNDVITGGIDWAGAFVGH